MDLVSFVAVPALAYLVMAALVAVDAVIPAVPGEVAVISSGALAAAGHLNIVWAIVAATLGALAGDLTVHGLSRRALPGALERFRLGRRLKGKISEAHERMGSTSAAAIIATRFIPLGRTAAAAAAGVAGMRSRRFAVIAFAAGLLWSSWAVGLGYVTGSVTDAPLWLQVAIGVAVGVLVGVWAGATHTIIRTRRRMTERARAAESSDREEPAPSRAAHPRLAA